MLRLPTLLCSAKSSLNINQSSAQTELGRRVSEPSPEPRAQVCGARADTQSPALDNPRSRGDSSLPSSKWRPAPLGSLSTPHPFLSSVPTLYPTKSPGLSTGLQPPVSSICGDPFLGGPPSPRVPPPGLRDLLRQLGLTTSSPRDSGLPQPRRQGPRHLPGETAAAGRGLAAPLTPEEEREERERECVSSSPLIKTSESSLSCSVTASHSPSPGYHRGSSKRPSPAEPVPSLSPPPGPGQGTSPPSRWGFCPNSDLVRAAAPPLSQPDAAPARSSATLR